MFHIWNIPKSPRTKSKQPPPIQPTDDNDTFVYIKKVGSLDTILFITNFYNYFLIILHYFDFIQYVIRECEKARKKTVQTQPKNKKKPNTKENNRHYIGEDEEAATTAATWLPFVATIKEVGKR